MKRNLEKVFASASIVVALVLIMILLVTAFGGIEFKEFDTKLVRGLLITLGILYLILASVSLTLVFMSGDAIKEIVLRSEQKGSVRASIGVVRKMVRTTCAEIDGVKCNKVGLVTDEYGVRLKVGVKVVDKDIIEVETYVRTMLEDVFMGALGFRFHTIEIKVTSLQPRYKADKAEIEKKVEERIAEIKLDQARLDEVVAASEEKEAGIAESGDVEEVTEIASTEIAGAESAAEAEVEKESENEEKAEAVIGASEEAESVPEAEEANTSSDNEDGKPGGAEDNSEAENADEEK